MRHERGGTLREGSTFSGIGQEEGLPLRVIWQYMGHPWRNARCHDEEKFSGQRCGICAKYGWGEWKIESVGVGRVEKPVEHHIV